MRCITFAISTGRTQKSSKIIQSGQGAVLGTHPTAVLDGRKNLTPRHLLYLTERLLRPKPEFTNPTSLSCQLQA